MMNNVIQDLDTTNLSIHVVKGWIAELRKLAFHVEDVMDKYSYHAFQLQEEGSLKRFLKGAHNAKVFSHIADEVVTIKGEIEQVKMLQKDYFPVIQVVPTSLAAIDRRGSQGCLPELVQDEDLVGIHVNRTKLITWLDSNATNSSVITVSGMGGLGKTTLVLNIYEHQKIKFPIRITVSQTYTIDVLLRELLRKIGNTVKPSASIDKMDVHELRQEIRSNLQGCRKCLFVLDDVWNKQVYLQMGDIFKNLQASRIIITTRRDDVASLAFSNCHLQLQPLGSPDAFNLFCRRAFNNTTDRKCPGELENVAASIVDRCKGLPFAIVSMGSLMSSKKRTEHAWIQIYKQFQSELAKPDNVLYCSMFPEDYIMSRESPVRQWVAEGIALTNENNTPEDVAELNLMELITRKLLQVVDYDELGRVNTCKMHDTVRDLALSTAKDEKFGSANDHVAMIKMDNDVRRLSSCGWQDSDADASTLSFPRLRTLMSLDTVTSATLSLSSCKIP